MPQTRRLAAGLLQKENRWALLASGRHYPVARKLRLAQFIGCRLSTYPGLPGMVPVY